MTPEEAAYVSQLEAQVKPRRRNGMWAMTRDNGFMFGESPFDSSSPFDLSSPFFPKRRR